MSKLSVSKYHKGGTVTIDDVELSLHVRRMTMDEFIEFEREYFDYSRGESKGSKVAVDTSAMEPEQAFLAIQKAEAEAELRKTPAEREAEREATIKRAAEMLLWVKARVEQNAAFPPGEVDIDGEKVETGEDITRVFGARQVLMMQFINQIWAQNRLPAGMLKNLPSPSDFPAGSGGDAREAAGPRPEPTAGSAGSSGFAETGDATPEQSSEAR
jgi:hypothetical protein